MTVDAEPSPPVAARRGAQARRAFARFLAIAFLCAAGLGLSVIYLASGLFEFGVASGQTWRASVTLAAGSLLIGLAAAFALSFAVGRRMLLQPYEALSRSQARLRDREAEARRLALVAEKASDLVIIYDRMGRIIWVNTAFVKTTGYAPDEAIGRRPAEFLSAGADPIARDVIETAIRRGEAASAQVMNRSKSGREYLAEVNISPVRDDSGVLTNFVAVERDVTDRHLAERRLREAVEIMEDGFSIYDEDDRLILFNSAYERVLGLEGRLREDMKLLDVAKELASAGRITLPEGGAEEWASRRSEAMKSASRRRFTATLGGRVLLHRNRTTDAGETVTLCTDVTELHEARRRAEEAVEAKTRFFASITHEVRTPLNGVIAMAELLLDGEATEQQRSGLELIARSGEALLTIINDILDFSKIDVGKMAILPAPFDVAEGIEDVIALSAPEAARKGVDLVYTVDSATPRLVMGDHGRVRQIATNLVGNAIKFTDQGVIAVRLGGAAHEGRFALELSVEDSGCGISASALERIFRPFEQVEGEVREGTGLGLPICRQLAELMSGSLTARSEPGAGSTFTFAASFEVLDGGGRPRPLAPDGAVSLIGSGPHVEPLEAQIRALGGVIAQNDAAPRLTIVALTNDGEAPPGLSDASEIPAVIVSPYGETPRPELLHKFPRGARILRRPVRLSAMARAVQELLEASPVDAGPTSEGDVAKRTSPRILAAEDNATNAAILRAMLARAGLEVDIWPDGASAIDAFKASRPDIVLMDVQLPDMTGREATRRIRALETAEKRRPTPIIAVTAAANQEERAACLAAGMDDFITKPLNKAQLTAKVEFWTGDEGAAGRASDGHDALDAAAEGSPRLDESVA